MLERGPGQTTKVAPTGRPRLESQPQYDAVVVGAGLGGIYAIYRLLREGYSVLGLEAAGAPGGVWLHNRYPGARVDVESFDYCYQFSRELFDAWRWSERYASQNEILRYINHVADRFDLRRHIRFNAALESAYWRPERACYDLTVSGGQQISTRFLVMATGNLSAPREPSFLGLSRFRGEWVQSSRWPDRDVAIRGRRVAVIGTGSSGVQIVPVVAREAKHLYVFQRTPNYSVPARNGPLDGRTIDAMVANFGTRRDRLLSTRAGNTAGLDSVRRYDEYTPEERAARLAHVWSLGGQRMNRVFADQGVDSQVNEVVADFVRDKIRDTVKDPKTAEALCPRDHPIGTRRLCMDSGYYETFNRSNVTLVDASASPIKEITESGIRTSDGEYAVDLIIFALGFHAFRGAMDQITIRNPAGEHPTDSWKFGPRTLLGLMTTGFPNFFFLTGPGSPSVLANMILMNEEHVNFVVELIAHMRQQDFTIVAPRPEAVAWWTDQVSAAAGKLLRLQIENYMVHVNDDGSRVFMPFAGGIDEFSRICRRIAAENFACLSFARSAASMEMSYGERNSRPAS